MGTDGAGSDDAPLSDLAREMRERRRREQSRTGSGGRDGPVDDDARAGGAVDVDGDGDADRDDPFESVKTPAVDAESVWETLASATVDSAAVCGGVGDPEAVEASAAGDEHVVPKRTYCQQCPHFSAPPEVACGHEDTAVVEVVDADRFRVRNCPVVRAAVESDADADTR